MTFENALNFATEKLKNYSPTPHLDAELLLMHCINNTREYIFTYPEKLLNQQETNQLENLIERRKSGEPIAYIIGYKEFWSLNLEVTPDVLIPRPETEHLIEWALIQLPEKKLSIADLGVGSGAIAIALADERPDWEIDATDINEKAIALAKRNAKRYQLENIHFYLGSWCEPLPKKNYNAIFSNPPYIDHYDTHLAKLKFEPRYALDGGKNGLDAIKIIIPQAKNYLAPEGYLVIEHGYDQQEKIMKLFEEAGYKDIEDHVDLAGLPRFTTAKK